MLFQSTEIKNSSLNQRQKGTQKFLIIPIPRQADEPLKPCGSLLSLEQHNYYITAKLICQVFFIKNTKFFTQKNSTALRCCLQWSNADVENSSSSIRRRHGIHHLSDSLHILLSSLQRFLHHTDRNGILQISHCHPCCHCCN